MGDEFSNTGSGNWWGASSRNRFDQSGGGGGGGGGGGLPSSSPSSSCSSSGLSCGNLDVVDDHHHHHHQQQHHHHHQHLQMMGLGLSSQPIDQWSQSLLRADKAETSFRMMLGTENMNQQEQQPQNMSSSPSPSTQAFWRDRGFFLDQSQSQFSPHGSSSDSTVTSQGLPTNANFQIDNSSTGIFQAFLGSDQPQNQPQQQSSFSYNHFGAVVAGNYGDQMVTAASPSTWPRPPVPQTFLRTSPPKPHSPLRFNNNAPFWNPSAAAAANVGPHDVPTNFFPTLQTQQIHTQCFDEKPKNMLETRDSSSTGKRSGSDQPTAKRTKSETQSPAPAFKVRKEKMGDRIAALQQLVSPFGKTDAASVLSEAIEYIKFLHEQVTALSNPYMKSGASLQHHQQISDQSNDPEAPKQDLRSRGLCLVPVSSTFPVTHETTVDFWTPTFGGTFR